MLRLTGDEIARQALQQIVAAEPTWTAFNLRLRIYCSGFPAPDAGTGGDAPWGDLAGQAKFGPDVEWVDAIDYDVDPQRAPSFYAGIRSYWPGVLEGAPQPGYAGSGSKIARPGGSTTDFLLQTEKDHNVAGLINLFGILVGAPGHDRQRFLPQSLRLPRRLPQARPHPMLESATTGEST